MAESDTKQNKAWHQDLLREAVRARMIAYLGKAIDAVILIAGIAVIVLIAAGGTVPAWTLGVALLIGAASVFVLRRYYLGRIDAIRTGEIKTLKGKLKDRDAALDRHDSYDNHIVRVLDYLQKVLARDMKITMSRFIEAGVLEASREVMIANGHDQDLRLSVLILDGDHFKMTYAAGHGLESREKFRVPVANTLAATALEQKVTQVWKDAPSERGFKGNPKATRSFRSMVSVPILVAENAVAVFNVITDRPDAFDDTDVSCCTSLGSVIQVALGVAVKDLFAEKKRDQQSAARKKAIRKRIAPSPPGGAVGSMSEPDPKEAPDG